MKSGSYVSGILAPKRTDDLRPGVEAWVGRRLIWEAMWVDKDDDPFPGEWHMQLVWRELPHPQLLPPSPPPFLWAPLCDLQEVVEVCRECRQPIETDRLWHDGCRGIRE